MNKIKSAEHFAKLKHKGQKRKDCKTPYWKHLQQVVNNLKKLGIKDQNVLCAGWLHDAIEDTSTDYDDLEKKFGKDVANMVSHVTKDKRLPQKKRELQYVKQLRNSTLEAKIIKLCDIVANVVDLENSGYGYQKKAMQVNDKLRYFSAIRYTISKNKTHFVGLDKIIDVLNYELKKYRKPEISL